MHVTTATPGLHIEDIRFTLAINPDCPPPLCNGWWQRTLSQVTGITLHHTLSHSPWATARYYIHKGGGRPTIPYHYWICSCGHILRCLDLQNGCWHDHTGHRNKNVSIGIAGSLHVTRPSEPQLASTALLIVHLLRNLNIPPNQVKGHNERSAPHGYATICPGWVHPQSGYWRADLLGRVSALLAHPNGG